jgi:hypothetical protein
MKFLLPLLLLNIFIAEGLAGQDLIIPVKQNSLSFNLGHIQNKEENLHPKVFRGFHAGAEYMHSHMKKHISEFSTHLNLSLLNTVYEGFASAPGISLQGHYHYLFPVIKKAGWNYYTGPAANLQYGANAYFNWDESHIYFANFISAGISNRLNFNTGNYIIVFTFDLPVFSFINRPQSNRQYKYDDFTFTGVVKNLYGQPEPAFPGNHFFMKSKLEFSLGKQRLRYIGFNFQYQYMRAEKGMPFQHVEQSVSYRYIIKP